MREFIKNIGKIAATFAIGNALPANVAEAEQRIPKWETNIKKSDERKSLEEFTAHAKASGFPTFIFGNERNSLPGHIEMCARTLEKMREIAIFCLQNKNVEPLSMYLNQISLDIIRAVHKNVNSEMLSVGDETLHDVAEYWEGGIMKMGDCEEYTLNKYRELLNRGFQPESMSLGYVEVKENNSVIPTGHLVLLVRQFVGNREITIVLDNLKTEPMLLTDYQNYKFVAATLPDITRWANITAKLF